MKSKILYSALGLILFAFTAGKIGALSIEDKVRGTFDGLSERYGIDLTYKNVSFISPWGATITEVTGSLPGQSPFLRADQVTAEIDLRAFFTGQPYVGTISISDLEVTLRRDSDGIWELTRIAPKASKGERGDRRSAVAWPLNIAVRDLGVAIDIGKDSAHHVYKSAHFLVDLPKKEVHVAVANENEKLQVAASAARIDFVAESVGLSLLAPFTGRVLDMATANVTASGTYREGRLVAEGALSDITVNHLLLARSAADGISFGFGLDLHRAGEIITLQNAFLSLGGESVSMSGTLEGRPKPIIDFRAAFNKTDIGRIVASIPKSLVPHLPDLAASGTIDGEFRFHLDLARPRTLDYRFDGKVDSFAITGLGPEIDIEARKKSFLHTVRLPGGETPQFIVGVENPDYVPLDDIPRALIGAVQTAEDGSFFSHGGFSAHHIRDAIVENLEAGRMVRGASTITMQLAKNLFLSREKTLSRKVEEALITMALEQKLEKKRMMEIYLNIIEWGPDIYGIGPAARYYFDKPVDSLGAIESAFLASIIARPNRNWGREPLANLGGWWSYVRVILVKMYHRGDVDIETLTAAGVSDTVILSLTDTITITDTAAERLPEPIGYF